MAEEKEVERCLVAPRRELFGYNDQYAFSGFKRKETWDVDLENILGRQGFYAPRKTARREDDVEYREDLKQMIPGVVFVHDGKIFTYTRLEGSGEARMVGRNDVLIGGHVNPEDREKTYQETFWKALHREFDEEVIHHDSYPLHHVGYVNDDDDPLGKVHFGLVYVIRGRSPNIAVRETEAMQGRLMTVEEVDRLNPPLQSWHKYIFDAYKRGELK